MPRTGIFFLLPVYEEKEAKSLVKSKWGGVYLHVFSESVSVYILNSDVKLY